MERGDIIQFIYTDAAHKNPLRRVMPLDLISEENDYDKEKYREMLLEAAETVSWIFRLRQDILRRAKENQEVVV